VNILITTSGNWIAPETGRYAITLIGGGGGGGRGRYSVSCGGGGGSGAARIVYIEIMKGELFQIVIGSGGVGSSSESSSVNDPVQRGTSGGQTSFDNYAALGGEGGVSGYRSDADTVALGGAAGFLGESGGNGSRIGIGKGGNSFLTTVQKYGNGGDGGGIDQKGKDGFAGCVLIEYLGE
jgi:hypothetical protein